MAQTSECRPIAIGDADAYTEFTTQLDRETKFMLFEPGERNISPEIIRKMIEASLEDSNVGWFVVEREGRIVGFLSATRAPQSPIRHRATLAIGLLADSQRRGFGTSLFERLFAWATERGVERIEFSVVKINAPAIALYKSLGFEIEGLKRRSFRVDSEWRDEYLMAKLTGD